MYDLVTCSLDKTIKVWDVHDASSSLNQSSQAEIQPRSTISTQYPVWRARNLPFGHGVLSLPQRGETTLEMYTLEGCDVGSPVNVFEGHADVVKEFVWRKGGLGERAHFRRQSSYNFMPTEGGEYQLITWSKDRTLRFWPVDAETMEVRNYLLHISHLHAARNIVYRRKLAIQLPLKLLRILICNVHAFSQTSLSGTHQPCRVHPRHFCPHLLDHVESWPK
jgi:WD repeat-containing protein 59